MFIIRWKEYGGKHWHNLATMFTFKAAEVLAIRTENEWRRYIETEGRAVEIKNTETGERYIIAE